MIYKDIAISYKQSWGNYNIYLWGDSHVGTVFSLESGIKNSLKAIGNDKHGTWFGMGDYGEFIVPGDKRFDPSHTIIAPWVKPDDIADSQVTHICNDMHPARKNCGGLLGGNHEDSIRRYYNNNVAQHICDNLGVDNLGYSSGIRLFFNRDNSSETHMLRMWLIHGASSAATLPSKVRALVEWMKGRDGEIYGYAHVHDWATTDKPYQEIKGKFGKPTPQEHTGIGVLVPCWFKTYSDGVIASYGEKKAYSPTVLGCAKIAVNLNDFSLTATRMR